MIMSAHLAALAGLLEQRGDVLELEHVHATGFVLIEGDVRHAYALLPLDLPALERLDDAHEAVTLVGSRQLLATAARQAPRRFGLLRSQRFGGVVALRPLRAARPRPTLRTIAPETFEAVRRAQGAGQ